jgi:O-acetyl-ADP-ribose deacetylase (regulator of RNase III)
MGQDLRTNDRYIRQATIASLNLAEDLKCKSVALPAFGTGVGGFPMKACANIMVKAARGYNTEAKYLQRVVFCLFDDYGYQIFKTAYESSY